MEFDYTVWFRDDALPPDDEDHECCACLRIEAESREDALAWGDPMYQDVKDWDSTPLVAYGVEATDAFIGW